VQDPADAEFPDLPRNALTALSVDRVVPLARIGETLRQLAGAEVQEHVILHELQLHAQLDRVARADPTRLDALGHREPAMCAECGGPLWRVRGEEHDIYRCYLGHAYSCLTLVRAQAEVSVQAMWNAVRSLEDSAFTFAARAGDARERGDAAAAAHYDSQVDQLHEQASRQRELIADITKTYQG
jgi:two-component system chemotaxis response regulator CheB